MKSRLNCSTAAGIRGCALRKQRDKEQRNWQR